MPADRPNRAGPEKVELFDPPAMVRAIVKGVEKRFPSAAEQLVSLNVTLDAFYEQLKQLRRSQGEGPGTVFVEAAMGLLQKEIEGRDMKLPLGGTT